MTIPNLEKRARSQQLNMAGVLKLAGKDTSRLWEVLKGITTPAERIVMDSQMAVIEALTKNLKATIKATEVAAKEIQAGIQH